VPELEVFNTLAVDLVVAVLKVTDLEPLLIRPSVIRAFGASELRLKSVSLEVPTVTMRRFSIADSRYNFATIKAGCRIWPSDFLAAYYCLIEARTLPRSNT